MGTFDASQSDPAMLELFQAEMDAHIPVLNRGLLALERGQADAAEIEAMMRAAHSIKGASRIVGVEPAVRVSHVMEDCFTAAKDSRIRLSSESVDVLLQGVDALQRICTPSDRAEITEESIQELIDRISLVRDGKAAASTAVTSTADESPPVVHGSRELVAATVRRDEPSITLPAVFDDAAASRVRSELRDTLQQRPRGIQIDFTHVKQLTAGALTLLAAFANDARAISPPPLLQSHGCPEAVRKLLRIAGLAESFGLNR